MDYLQEWQQKLNQQNQRRNLENLANESILGLQDKIVMLQQMQISNHEGFDDAPLKSISNDGLYKPATSNFAALGMPPALTRKPAGSPYNFVWTGEFMSNFRVKKSEKGFKTYSTGTGSGAKKEFFEDYTNMFGLNTDNTATVLSEVENYVLDKVLGKIYG